MSKKMIRLVCLIVILLSSLPTWAQDDKEEKIPLYYDDETELKGGRPRTVFLIPKLYKKGNLIYLRTNEDRCSVKLTIISVDPQIRNYAPNMIQKRKESASLVKRRHSASNVTIKTYKCPLPHHAT